jgi:anti-sigma factor RsiW
LPWNCLNDDTLAGYADGSLGTEERARVDEHVDSCNSCRRLLAAVGAATDGEPAPPVAPDGEVR